MDFARRFNEEAGKAGHEAQRNVDEGRAGTIPERCWAGIDAA